MLCSGQILRNRPFHPTLFLLFTMHFPLSRLCIRLGRAVSTVISILTLLMLSVLVPQRYNSIMSSPPTRMLIRWRCVRIQFFKLSFVSHSVLLVLDPSVKMSYFQKHWSKELQDEVIKSAEGVVRFSCCLLRQCG